MAETRPNLLFVFADQHRRFNLSCYGDKNVRSPRLDGFARQGVRFDNAVSNSPVCVPMRGSLLTGLHPWNHRALTNDLPIDPACPSIARWLDAAGYATGYIGKWHLGGVPRDKIIPGEERLGFGYWRGVNCNHAYDQGYYFDEDGRRRAIAGFQSIGETDMALDFLRGRAGADAPWALFLSWGPPHEPFNAVPREYLELYDPASPPLRPNVPPDIEGAARQWLHGYYGLISLLDVQFGRLLDAVDALGVADDTLIVYTSDHGDLLGSHGMRNKQQPHEESIAVPLLARWPKGLEPGARAQLHGLVDLPVTLAGLLDLPAPGNLDGRDRSAMWRDAKAPGPDSVLIHNLVPCHQAEDRGDRPWMGLRTPRWTYARHPEGDDFVLFDNARDPFQRTNPAAVDPAPFRARLDQALAEAGYRFRPWDAMIREDGFLPEWNKSQRYFGRPELPA